MPSRFFARIFPVLTLTVTVAFGAVGRAEVRLHSLVSDHAVLQRDRPIPVWGRAAPGEEVSVEFAGHRAATRADADGRWSVRLPACAAAVEPRDMTVRGGNEIVVRDLLVGDVWLCSGQSNMSISAGHFSTVPEVKADLAAADLPLVRHFGVPDVAAPEPQEDVAGQWLVCTPRTAGRFTAVGFYFARAVHRETGVPIGIVRAAKGSTRIEVWLPGGERHNAMLAPLTGLALRGGVWYQGESNAGDAAAARRYVEQSRELVADWRRRCGDDTLPFFFVQLPAYGKPTADPGGGDSWARLREAQAECLAIAGTGMAVALDLGEAADIHPRNKADVGERLALLALRDVYGTKDLVAEGPRFRGMQVEGAKVRLSFDAVGGGLMAGRKEGRAPVVEEPGPLRQFAIAGADRTWHRADAVIDGDAVVVSADAVTAPVAVRYAYATNPEGANLYNRAGLPAAPFRTDDW